jgi:signal transduction histidine kinase
MLSDRVPQQWVARTTAVDAALVGGLSFLLALVSIALARQPGTIATLWLANGAAAAIIASAPRPRAGLLLGCVALAHALASLASADPTTLVLLLPHVAEVAWAAWLLRGMPALAQFNADPSVFLRVMARGALLPPLLGATAGAAMLQALGYAEFSRVWLDGYIGSALGAWSLIPLVLALRQARQEGTPSGLFSRPQLLSLGAVALVFALALRFSHFPFVWLGTMMTLLALVRPRLLVFAGSAAMVCLLALSLAYDQVLPSLRRDATHHLEVHLAALLCLLPAQLLSIVLARQRALAQTLAAVGSRADEIVVYADPQGHVRWVNKARELYWGQPADAVLGRHWSQNIPAQAYDSAIRPAFEAALAGQSSRRLIDYDYPLRGVRTTDFLMRPAYDDEGHLIGVVYSGTDVTALVSVQRELEQASQQLMASNQRLEQFVRIASHDLREPLNTIAQFCSLIDQGHSARLDDQGRRYFGQVREGAERMRAMLDDVLQLVQLDDAAPLPCERVDLDRLVTEVLAALQARIDQSRAQVQVGAAGEQGAGPALGTAWGRPALLSLVLQNLLSNALKFVAPGQVPQVRIEVARDAQWLHLAVVDNGIGIPADKLAALGTPFRRLHARRVFEGTGLGLAIAMRIARLHAGAIEISSTPGAGSRFTLVLPVEAAGADEPVQGAAALAVP